MATYAELLTLATTDDLLKQKVSVACIVACDIIRLEDEATPNHANRQAWANKTLQNPDTVSAQMVRAVLAQNRALTVAQISGANDAAIQTAVNAAVDLLAG
jgi:hypothetical protein